METNTTGTALRKKKGIKDIFRSLTSGTGLAATIIALIIMIVIQCVVIGLNEGSFAGLFPTLFKSWLNILRNNTYTGVIALGMCLVIISGGIDLSVGSMTCAIGAALMYLIDPATGLLARLGISGTPAYLTAIILAVALGFVFGEINGLLISYGKIPPFIVTLGTMKIFRSVTQQLTKHFNPKIPAGFKQIASFRLGDQVILPIIYWIIATVILSIVFKKTAFGKQGHKSGGLEYFYCLIGAFFAFWGEIGAQCGN